MIYLKQCIKLFNMKNKLSKQMQIKIFKKLIKYWKFERIKE